ncbi:MAG TPA: hypothetical protein PLK28_05900, partial [Candidatus Rifleibacterium sp.]|nr:hypothetical protein [Candidatus Rifleibacterium sp.]
MSVFSRYRLAAIFLVMLVTVVGCRLISFSGDDSFPSIGTISGRVVKDTSDANLRMAQGIASGAANAEVWLDELPIIRTLTDADGNFTLTGVPNGTFHIVARYFNGGVEMKFRLVTPVVVNGDTPQTVAEIKPLPARVKITGILLGIDNNPLPTGTKLYIWGESFEIQEGGKFETPFLPEGFLENEIYFPGIGGQPECRIPVLFGQSDPPVFSELKIFPYGQHPPAVGISVSDGTKITSSVPVTGRLTLTQHVYDPVDQEKVTTQWSASRGILSDTASPGIKIWTPPVDGGVATITLKATDGEGSSRTSKILVTVIGRLSSEKSISAFGIANPAATGSINETERTIQLSVPYGTDLTNLTATFSLSERAIVKVGATVQTSDTTANDFTSPVTYTVVAED